MGDIKIKRRNLYFIGAVIVLLIGISFVASYSSIPNPGHGGNEIWIEIPGGEEMTLQQAVDSGVFSPSLMGDGIGGPVKNISFARGYVGGTTCAILTDQTVRCCGRNDHGQLGIGDTVGRIKFTEVAGLSDVKEIVGERLSFCVLFDGLDSGKVKCWGYNAYGNLGTGDTKTAYTPQFVQDESGGDLTDVKKIARRTSVKAYEYTCALLNSGKVKCWGYNGNGQLGVGDKTSRTKASEVSNLNDDAKDLKLGGFSSGGFSCALLNSGKVKCWGYNGYGQLGVGDQTASYTTPQFVQDESGGDLTDVKEIYPAPGDHGYACALLNSGKVKCWGYNGYGQLGVGDTTLRTKAIEVHNIGGSYPNAVKLELIGPSTTGSVCALLDDGTMKCWGYNGYGRLGVGDSTRRSVPTVVVGINNAKDIQGFGYGEPGFYCALLDDKTVKCWGHNGYGQLGVGDTTLRNTPESVIGLTDVESIFCGGQGGGGYACAIINGGALKCWGYNAYGNLGTGDKSNYYVPAIPA